MKNFNNYLLHQKKAIFYLAKEKMLKEIKEDVKVCFDLTTFNYDPYFKDANLYLEKAINAFIIEIDTKTLERYFMHSVLEKRADLVEKARKSKETKAFIFETESDFSLFVKKIEKQTELIVKGEIDKRKRVKEKKEMIKDFINSYIEKNKETLFFDIKKSVARHFLYEKKMKDISASSNYFFKEEREFLFYEFTSLGEFLNEQKEASSFSKKLKEAIEEELIKKIAVLCARDLSEKEGRNYFRDLSKKADAIYVVREIGINQNVDAVKSLLELFKEIEKENFQEYLLSAFSQNAHLNKEWKKVRIKRIVKN